MSISILFLVVFVAIFLPNPSEGQLFNNRGDRGPPRPQYNGYGGGYGYVMYYELCPWCTCPFCVGPTPPTVRSTTPLTTTEFQRQEESTTTEAVTETTTTAVDTTTETTAADTETITTEDPTTTTMMATETTEPAETDVPTEAPTTPRRVATSRRPNVSPPSTSCMCQWAGRMPQWRPSPPRQCIFCGGSFSSGFFGRRSQFNSQWPFGGEGRNGFYRNGFRMGGRWTDSPYYSGRMFNRPQVEIFSVSRRSFNQGSFQNRFLFG